MPGKHERVEGLPPCGMDVAWQERDAAVRAAVAENGYFIGEAADGNWKEGITVSTTLGGALRRTAVLVVSISRRVNSCSR